MVLAGCRVAWTLRRGGPAHRAVSSGGKGALHPVGVGETLNTLVALVAASEP